jgi:hypothetical protein
MEIYKDIATFGLEDVATAPLECMGLDGYVPRLLFWMALPLFLTLLIVGLVVLSSWWGWGELARLRRKSSWRRASGEPLQEDSVGEALFFHLQSHEEKQRQANSFEKSLRFVLLIMFVLYPKVTNVAFEGFPCCEDTHGSNARRRSAHSDL